LINQSGFYNSRNPNQSNSNLQLIINQKNKCPINSVLQPSFQFQTEMASMFLGRWGLIASYVTLTVYLFGDLAIYSSTVPKSIMNIICSTVNSTDIWPSTRWYDECRHGWPSVVNTRISIYRISVLLFVTLITPLVVVGITRTKYLQLSTSFCRWTAFALMICLAVISLIRDGPEGAPPAVHFSGFGLFGIYLCVLAFYVALSLTGVFAFGIVFDVYTLNFLHDETSEESIFYAILNHFLALFPVFTLSTNYPIVATTLHNNLHVLYELIRNAFVQLSASQLVLITNNSMVYPLISIAYHALFYSDGDDQGPLLDNEQPIAQLASQQPDDDNTDTQPSTTHSNTLIRVIILSLVIIIPTLIALLTDNVLLLASLTGSYPGVGVQFVIPSLLVIYARRCCKRELGIDVPRRSSSPFAANLWPWLMFVWAAFTTLMVTLNFYCL
uniref:Transmembrane protein 104 homolog (inferred by orthology to a C. elegans protein) n=1 Tax=Anisakis simplex TaxID=6269 RepID=A0A0M3JRC2_ANISI